MANPGLLYALSSTSFKTNKKRGSRIDENGQDLVVGSKIT
jgi:hypothetical protein